MLRKIALDRRARTLDILRFLADRRDVPMPLPTITASASRARSSGACEC
jgi:hypothetical protein